MLGGTATGKGYITRIKCPRHCGWFRDYTNQSLWLINNVDHPLYGTIGEEQLVKMDVLNHDCIEAANARLRANLRKVNNGTA